MKSNKIKYSVSRTNLLNIYFYKNVKYLFKLGVGTKVEYKITMI